MARHPAASVHSLLQHHVVLESEGREFNYVHTVNLADGPEDVLPHLRMEWGSFLV